MSERPRYGETWVYESIVGALPGIDLPAWAAVAVQILVFEGALLVLAAYYGLWEAAIAGTVAVVVAAVGSVEMLRIGTLVRRVDVPQDYRDLLFSSSVEVVLSVLAYVALVTHLFVFDPGHGDGALLDRLFGQRPPVLVAYLLLLILWDVCYRFGTGWWAAVTALWRSARYRFDPETAASLRRADAETLGFGVLQLVLVPFVLEYPVLLAAVVAHVAAVTVVTTLSILLLRQRERVRRT
ncbi:DUF7530 family protein [Halomicrobium salinisoli]|uniref:DUF7530 family protein n=1 Tax=Halomicrobium salinisoli TaxID=2878391 RepID=UPI001CF0396C|nr:hypothetical protein [Halomicrobium salinisoli]